LLADMVQVTVAFEVFVDRGAGDTQGLRGFGV
jgi:hypothetical protein